MSGNTANRVYTYPQLSDAANVPFYMQQLATQIDTDVELTQHPALAIMNRTAVQVTTASTPVAMAWNAADTVDTVAGHDIVTNNSRYTVQTGKQGYYRCTARISFAANTGGVRVVYYRVNGVSTIYGYNHLHAQLNGVSTEVHSTIIIPVFLNATDYIEVWVNQNSGVSLNVTGTWDVLRESE